MFESKVYTDRRNKLRRLVPEGIILLPGNQEASMNYPSNTYHFRQDSNFLYYFGLNQPGLIGVIDSDENKDILFGNDVDIDDIIWMGPQPTMKDRAGVRHVSPYCRPAALWPDICGCCRTGTGLVWYTSPIPEFG